MIRKIIPGRLEIGDGFIFTSSGKVSTQCDIIIYDKNNCPLIENNNKQRFFPIECVVAIGEVKSNLTKSELKDALLKLQNNKKLRSEISFNNPYVFCDGEQTTFNPVENPKDQIISFLICNRINKCDFHELVNEMDKIYNCDRNYYLRHNLILSVTDGTIMYKEVKDGKKFSFYPIINGNKKLNSFLPPTVIDSEVDKKNGQEHIIGFLNYLYMGVSMTSIMYPEMTNYLGGIKLRKSYDESYD